MFGSSYFSGGGPASGLWLTPEQKEQKRRAEKQRVDMVKAQKREKKRQEKIKQKREDHKAKRHKEACKYIEDAKNFGKKKDSSGPGNSINRSALMKGGNVGFANAISSSGFRDPNANPYEVLMQQKMAASANNGPPKLKRS